MVAAIVVQLTRHDERSEVEEETILLRLLSPARQLGSVHHGVRVRRDNHGADPGQPVSL